MIYKFFDKKSALLNKSTESGIAASLAKKSANEPNYQLANELHKPIIKKLKKKEKFIHFLETISGVLI